MQSQTKINTVGRSPLIPGDNTNIALPSNVVQQRVSPSHGASLTPTRSLAEHSLMPHTNSGKSGIKRRAGKENIAPPTSAHIKRPKLSLPTAHVGDHSITATEVSSQILADGIDVTLTGQGCDILKQYIDTFFGPVPGFQLNVETAAHDVSSEVASINLLVGPGQWSIS